MDIGDICHRLRRRDNAGRRIGVGDRRHVLVGATLTLNLVRAVAASYFIRVPRDGRAVATARPGVTDDATVDR